MDDDEALPGARMKKPTSFKEALKRSSGLYLSLDVFVLLVLAWYRARAHSIMGGISPELLSGERLSGYLAAALSSDLLAMAAMLALLGLGWLLSPLCRRLALLLSLLLAAAYAILMISADDFLRVYQTAFRKDFVGGEHYTGVKSMLISAATEISPVSRLGLAAAALVLALATWLGLGKRNGAEGRRMGSTRRLASIVLSLAPALCLLGAFVASRAPVAAAPAGAQPSAAREQGRELAANPFGSLLFGAGRATFMPHLVPKARLSNYPSDSMEKPTENRFLPVVKKGPYNVILYFFESTSWRYYDLEQGGEPLLPAMHSLASRGLLLANHYSNYPLSANTMYSVLSSRYSMYGKSMIFSEYHDVDVHTMPELLHDRGYATCLIHTGDLLYASRNKFLANRGIDRIILYKDLMKGEAKDRQVGWGADERLMTRPAVEWIKAQTSPYLLMMLPVNPHHPYAIPADVRKIADPEEPGISQGERTWRNYLNSLHYADAAMGEFVDELERQGLMENTVFVMVTDHGEAFYQHRGNYNHPLFIYEENVHTPALFFSKDLFPVGLRMDSITRHIDILPSILDLLGMEDVTGRDGESIFSLSKEKMAVVHTSWTDELMGVRDGRWKYIKRMKDSREELYDLETDPLEKNNIAEGRADIALRYRKVSDDMVSYMVEQYRDIARKK
jgi:arylsulfatase A-like enzyme